MGESLRKMVILARENWEVEVRILRNFEPLMKKCIWIYVKDYSYYEDAMQEARLTVLQCIKRYDIDSPIPFEGYVKRAVIYSIRDFADRMRFYVSIDEEINENGCTLYDVLRSDEDIEEEKIHKEELEELRIAFGKLPANYKNILLKYYFEKMSLKEISNNRRCHYMTVVKLKERALKYLREQLDSIMPDFVE